MDARSSWPEVEQLSRSYYEWQKCWELCNLNSSVRHSNNTDRKTDTPDSSKDVTENQCSKDDKQCGNSSFQTDGIQALRRRKENRATTYGLNSLTAFHYVSDSNLMPWKPFDKTYSNTTAGLNEEIEDFINYITPKEQESYMRESVVERIRNVVQGLWSKNVKVEVFGSVRTGLYLPTSDIDILISGNEWDSSTSPLRALEKELIEKGFGDPESIRVLDKASVPIIKVTDKKTFIRVDISFNIPNAVASAELIMGFLDEFPVLRVLVLVLKQFLLQRDLNEVYTGGISSYCLLLMVYSFLQLHPRSEACRNPKVNCGVLLIEFLEMYGRLFNYLNIAIRVRPQGAYVPKDEMLKNMKDGYRPSLLCIQDPLEACNDIGRSSYGVLNVKQVFQTAYIALRFVLPENNYYSRTTSILGRIIRITDDVVDYRKWVIEQYSITPEQPLTTHTTSMQTSDINANEIENRDPRNWHDDEKDQSSVTSSTSVGGSSGALSDVESESSAIEVGHSKSLSIINSNNLKPTVQLNYSVSNVSSNHTFRYTTSSRGDSALQHMPGTHNDSSLSGSRTNVLSPHVILNHQGDQSMDQVKRSPKENAPLQTTVAVVSQPLGIKSSRPMLPQQQKNASRHRNSIPVVNSSNISNFVSGPPPILMNNTLNYSSGQQGLQHSNTIVRASSASSISVAASTALTCVFVTAHTSTSTSSLSGSALLPVVNAGLASSPAANHVARQQAAGMNNAGKRRRNNVAQPQNLSRINGHTSGYSSNSDSAR